MAYLQRRVSSNWETVVELTKSKVVTLGRDKSSDVLIKDPHCSRRQAEIYWSNGTWMIRDVGSHNGTEVSGEVLNKPRVMQHGDVIRLGSHEFLFGETANSSTPRDESSLGSVSAWVKNLKNAPDGDAAQFEIWQRYYDRLARLAKRKLGDIPRRVADEEDAVAGAFNSFFAGVEQEKFPRLDDRNDLWGILATITVRKVCRQIERETAKKRGGGQVAGESFFSQDAGRGGLDAMGRTDDELYVEFEDTWQQYMNALPDNESRQIVEMKLGGFSNAEIARELNVSLSTVERRLRVTREVWNEQFSRD